MVAAGFSAISQHLSCSSVFQYYLYEAKIRS